jgi:hypothetical protein
MTEERISSNIFFQFIFRPLRFMMSSYFSIYSLRFLKLVEEHKKQNEMLSVIAFSRFSFHIT